MPFKSTDLGRHSLLYIKEIGHGWFGKVLLGEVHSGLSNTQVVVKELKASASVQDQMHFLEEARPYRSLQHPALVQCLAQCTEVTPYLVVMEFCPLGDVKGYLRSCWATDSMTPDPLLLQRMACEITSGLLHLHKNNFTHSDLALRNCLLTSDIKVKIGDYGLSHNKYKDDYFVTSDQTWIPLRWIAPELVDEVHGNLLVVDQTKESNIWSLGVTIWELFELGNQPYRHYSDRQVLSYAVKDQQLKLPKPLLKYPLSDRWWVYEVMQFCWLQPDQRPNAEEVHLLLSYLCAKGASEAEEDFERRWNSMRPNTSHANVHGAGALAIDMPMSSTTSSFPLLEQFPTGDGYHSESGDDILTVTETSHGLNFEYKWEQARAEQHYQSSSTTGVSPSYYEPKKLHTPGVVPVLSAHSPSVNNEYYIRIEEPVQSNIDMNFTMCAYSPDSAYDSDTSPAMSLTMEPLLDHGSPLRAWEDGGYYYEPSPPRIIDRYLIRDPTEPPEESWGSRNLRQALGELEEPLGVSPSLGSPPQGYADPYLENIQGSIIGKNVMGGYYDMMGSLRKTMPGSHSVCIDMASGGAEVYPVPCCQALSSSHFVDPLTGTFVRNCFMIDCIPGKPMTLPKKDQHLGQAPLSVGYIVSKIESSGEGAKQFDFSQQYVDIAVGEANLKQEKALHEVASPTDPKTEIIAITPQLEKSQAELPKSEPESDLSKTADSGVDHGRSSISLVEIDDCSDDDITDVTSGIFGDFTIEVETVDYTNPTFKSLQKQVGTPDSMDSIDIPSTACSSETLSPASIHPSSSPKTVDSGYDTENNESPEFVLKEPHELQDSKVFIQPLGKVTSGSNFLKALSDKTPYRDSAYFSDYDAGKDKESEEDINELEDQKDGPEEIIDKEEQLPPKKEADGDEYHLPSSKETEKAPEQSDDATSNAPSKIEESMSGCNRNSSVPLSSPDNEVFTRSGSPPPPLEGRVSPTDGEEADEEDGDSEDSDESDEELRTYSIQEQSEESEDEILTVPIIVSDCSDAHKLRSLLKMPTLLSDSLSDETENKKKVVSFFDDVTVFLFDQESPTKELADQSFPLGGEPSKPSAKGKAQNQQEKVNASDDSSDGNISEESAGFEWEDDFPLLPLPTSPKGSPPDITAKPSLPSGSTKPVAQVSRFTVSPSSVSRFSITHVSDSDMDSAGGETAHI
uniref:non-specific serine/threonine protein kinase n=1 Tax=Sinocyclocheilus rhinocerous TaxID=307959 RepID=A0A673JKX3_9TELE